MIENSATSGDALSSYVRGALAHLPGLGPTSIAKLDGLGIRTWEDVAVLPASPRSPLPRRKQDAIVEQIRACEAALKRGDLHFLAGALKPKDHWRLLADFREELTFFDIETSGLGIDDHITVIACLHRDRVRTFLWPDQLDDFLDVLEGVRLLVSFNGNTFDVPKLLRHFHIPELPCAHVDLRWVCFHAGLKGGLKDIETKIGMRRPDHLLGCDGLEAVLLWQRYQTWGDRKSLHCLLQYVEADVLSLNTLCDTVVRSHCRAQQIDQGERLRDAVL